jgi:hypothetical protein
MYLWSKVQGKSVIQWFRVTAPSQGMLVNNYYNTNCNVESQQ